MAEKELFEWGDKVGSDVESKEFELLPDGDYDFAVAKYEKKEKETKDGINNQVVITFVIHDKDGVQRQMMDFILLTQKMKWRLTAFLRSVGVQKKGQPLDMSYYDAFEASKGKEGRFQLTTEEYQGKKHNRIKKYYDKEGGSWKDGDAAW